MARLRDAVVVCTKDRPQDVARCLDSIAAQADGPELVLVVDSSAAADTRGVVAGRPGAVYVESTPGLTHQRNVGVHALPPDVEIVHFVDDDVVLEPGYFAALREAFADPAVAGAGGLITNVTLPDPPLLARIFLQDSRRRGAVLRSGRNILAHGMSEPTEVDWLSGCSMSFRRSELDRVPFDERVGIVGEDVDYALRLGGRLLAIPTARLEHRQSPVNRLAQADWNARFVVQRHAWLDAHPRRLSRLAFWWSALGEFAFALMGVARRAPDAREHLRSIMGAYRAVLARR